MKDELSEATAHLSSPQKEGCLMQSVLPRQSRANQSAVHILQRSFSVSPRIGDKHLSRQILPWGLLMIYLILRREFESGLALRTFTWNVIAWIAAFMSYAALPNTMPHAREEDIAARSLLLACGTVVSFGLFGSLQFLGWSQSMLREGQTAGLQDAGDLTSFTRVDFTSTEFCHQSSFESSVWAGERLNSEHRH
jgi:hypothetical protein